MMYMGRRANDLVQLSNDGYITCDLNFILSEARPMLQSLMGHFKGRRLLCVANSVGIKVIKKNDIKPCALC